MEIEEINLRSRIVLPDNQPPPQPREFEGEGEGSNLKVNTPFCERLAQPLQPIPEQTELLGELKNICVKIPLL